MNPLVSVVMSTYNRADILKESVDSILNQSFTDFEFIIINDCSTDSTLDIISSYSDSRIKLISNRSNYGCTFNYHLANNLAKGQYVAHIDDDDVSFPARLQKQVEFMEKNNDISLLGTLIETFGDGKRPSWVFYEESNILEFVMNFYNPICHSSVMYRKSFVDKQSINYDVSKKCAQDYDFYKQIILKGGKLANLPEVLVKYRMHKNRLTDVKETQNIQIDVAENVKNELLSVYFSKSEIYQIKEKMKDFPFNKYNEEAVFQGLEFVDLRINSNTELSKKIIFDIKNKRFQF